MTHQALLTLGLIGALAGVAQAQTQAQTQTEDPRPGVVIGGSRDVLSGGLPASRQGDATTNTEGAGVQEGSKDVLINGRPAARVGDRTNCGVIVRGSNNVYINGRPMARTGDTTSGC